MKRPKWYFTVSYNTCSLQMSSQEMPIHLSITHFSPAICPSCSAVNKPRVCRGEQLQKNPDSCVHAVRLCAAVCAGLLWVVPLPEASGFLQNLSCELDIQWEASACHMFLKRSLKFCYFNASFIVFCFFFNYPLKFVAGLGVQQNACQTSGTAERQGKLVLWTLMEGNLEGESWE